MRDERLLDAYVRVEDALAAIRDNISREVYEDVHKPKYRALYAAAYESAERYIKHSGSLRKAMNAVRKQIDIHAGLKP